MALGGFGPCRDRNLEPRSRNCMEFGDVDDCLNIENCVTGRFPTVFTVVFLLQLNNIQRHCVLCFLGTNRKMDSL